MQLNVIFPICKGNVTPMFRNLNNHPEQILKLHFMLITWKRSSWLLAVRDEVKSLTCKEEISSRHHTQSSIFPYTKQYGCSCHA